MERMASISGVASWPRLVYMQAKCPSHRTEIVDLTLLNACLLWPKRRPRHRTVLGTIRVHVLKLRRSVVPTRVLAEPRKSIGRFAPARLSPCGLLKRLAPSKQSPQEAQPWSFRRNDKPLSSSGKSLRRPSWVLIGADTMERRRENPPATGVPERGRSGCRLSRSFPRRSRELRQGVKYFARETPLYHVDTTPVECPFREAPTN
jgi:hypothetical protein